MGEESIVKYQTDHGEVKLSPGIIKKYLVSGNGAVTDQEVVMFLKLCEGQKLNPFLREAYLIKYGNSNPATMVVGKDVFTRRAAANPQYNGMESGICIKNDHGIEYRPGTLMLDGENLVGGWAKVYVKGWDYPVFKAVSFSEYVGKKNDGSVNSQWKRMPATMIAKVAISHALREAFPQDFAGLYDAAEMGHAVDKELPENKVQPTGGKEPEAKEPAPEPEKKTEEQPQAQQDDVEDADYEYEDVTEEEPATEQEPAVEKDSASHLRGEAAALLAKMGEYDLLTPSQVDTLKAQLTSMKSEAALRAMIKNFSGKVAQAENKEV